MKLWVGIIIGLLIGFIIGIIIMPTCEYDLEDYDLENSCDEYLDSCYELVDDWKDLQEDTMSDWKESNDAWEEMYYNLLDDCYDSDYSSSDYDYSYPICSYNAYNCADFNNQAEAQTVMEYCGSNDIHYLDGDDDGIACEELR